MCGCRLALQHLRSNANTYDIDKSGIGALLEAAHPYGWPFTLTCTIQLAQILSRKNLHA
jgi:hypothetical protein